MAPPAPRARVPRPQQVRGRPGGAPAAAQPRPQAPDGEIEYNRPMLQHLRHLSAVLFYLLGLSFFAAYFLVRTDFGGAAPALWLTIGDLPLTLAACLYGGTSLYGGIANPEKHSRTLALTIALPLALLFLFLVTLNFWEVLGLPVRNY